MDNIWLGPWAIFPQYVDGAFSALKFVDKACKDRPMKVSYNQVLFLAVDIVAPKHCKPSGIRRIKQIQTHRYTHMTCTGYSCHDLQ